MLEPYAKKISLREINTSPAISFYVDCFEILRNEAKNELKEHFA